MKYAAWSELIYMHQYLQFAFIKKNGKKHPEELAILLTSTESQKSLVCFSLATLLEAPKVLWLNSGWQQWSRM